MDNLLDSAKETVLYHISEILKMGGGFHPFCMYFQYKDNEVKNMSFSFPQTFPVDVAAEHFKKHLTHIHKQHGIALIISCSMGYSTFYEEEEAHLADLEQHLESTEPCVILVIDSTLQTVISIPIVENSLDYDRIREDLLIRPYLISGVINHIISEN